MPRERDFAPAWEYSARIENAEIDLLVRDDCLPETDPEDPVLHVHAFPELFVCKRGKLNIKTADGVMTLDAGDAASVPPGVAHVAYRAGAGTLYAAFSFRVTKRKNAGSEDLFKTLLPFTSGESVAVIREEPAFIRTAEEIKQKGSSQPGILAALAFARLLVVFSQPSSGAGTKKSKASGETPSGSDLKMMNFLEELIEKRFPGRVCAGELAEVLHISSRQLSRTVKKLFGMTLHELILSKRVREAERLLSGTKMTVENVAAAGGFGSAAGLYREFSKRLKTTPAKYRKKHRIDDISKTAKK
ncbi:MAG: helix-turn-helix domain-containing protein [Clostridia bacterium]|nr:helix-turn-helix domain-containing protein [Clostridia bacterium]